MHVFLLVLDSVGIGEAPDANVSDVASAVQAAQDAFEGWWATPAARRGEILYACMRAMHANEDELAQSLTAEQGKPLREARLEIRRFAHTLEHYAGLSKNLRGGYVPSLDEGAYGLIIKRPLGVVAAIVPWNFPDQTTAAMTGAWWICRRASGRISCRRAKRCSSVCCSGFRITSKI